MLMLNTRFGYSCNKRRSSKSMSYGDAPNAGYDIMKLTSHPICI